MNSPGAGTPPRLVQALSGRYRIERELGAGGMATVYLAHDEKHDRKVAIKVLKPELAAVLGAERFVVEIRTTASLSHPHILPLFDSGTADGFLYYVMPYIEGETIREKLNRETQFGIEEAVRIVTEVADALDYAHRHGVIHRDIKPENILLHDGRPMVMDFGIALAVSAAAGGRMTETGLSLGTPHYMSPEQATADKAITARSDVYSLASVLYEMLTGQPPHLGGSAQQIIMKIIADTPRPLTELRKSAPPHVAAAVAQALEKLPADRFESAKAFSDALGNTGFVTHATMGPASSVTRRTGIPRSTVGAAAVAVMAIATAAWALLRPDPPPAVTRVSVALPEDQQLSATRTWRVALSPDGRTIAYVGGRAGDTKVQIWARKLDQLTATPLAGTEGASIPSFSPDGTRLAYLNSEPTRSLRVIPVSGGPIITITDSLVDAGGLSWGNDGYIYYDGKLAGDGLARVRETGGTSEVASLPDSALRELWHSGPSALPNGRGVLFVAAHGLGTDNYDVAVLDTRTRKHTVLVHGVAGRYVPPGQLIYVTANGTMMAVPFDENQLRITGDPVAIAEGVAVGGLGGTDIAVSRTGTLLYAAGANGDSESQLVWVSRDGRTSVVDSTFTGRLSVPRLSPDGRSVAVVRYEGSRPTVVVKQLDRGAATKVADDASSPAWSADGQSLFIMTPRGIEQVPADGSRHPDVVLPGIAPTRLTTSVDGKWLVFAVRGALQALVIGDTVPRQLLDAATGATFPALSPDGRWLAYSSQVSGRFHVYVVPFPDVSRTRHQVSTDAGGLFARWSRDGRELVFLAEAGPANFAVPIAPGATFSAGTPRLIPSLAGVSEPAADGRYLALRALGQPGPQRDALILVEHFAEELRARMRR